MKVEVRDATPSDQAAFLDLWNGYLDFYRVDLAPEVTAATWSRLMDPAAPVKARLAILDGKVRGFAIHLHHPSTWVVTEDCYLEDLYVDESVRGAGLGRALLDDLVSLARAKGWARLYWHTNHDNTRARALYDQYVASDGHIRYRMTL
ncbi:MAG: GNAT family N-acetyltransferase [Rhodobacterales bacterium]|nr:GNAT family N-acetyltransferase [Rhodobacterales bacterium]